MYISKWNITIRFLFRLVLVTCLRQVLGENAAGDNSPLEKKMNSINKSLLELIGNTPMLKLTAFDTGPCELFVKLENQNPGGSIKDRIGLSIIEEAEKSGRLAPGGTIIEATAGNTGIGLALVAAIKGYKLILVIPDKMSREKILHLEGLGVEVIITRSDVAKGHPDHYQDMAQSLAEKTPNSFLANQFDNPANALAHYATTGPEIWEQTNGQVDAVVAGVGSGGTVAGLAKFFKEKSPHIDIVVADPVGSIMADAVKTGEYEYNGGSWLVEGIGEDFVPNNIDLNQLDDAETVPDKEAFSIVKTLLREEGILAGSSSGTLIGAAVRWCQRQTEPKTVVSFVCDTGNKYLSKAFNPPWLKDNDLVSRGDEKDLSDLISRRADLGEMVSVSAQDSLLTAFKRMRSADVSQLPVMDGCHLLGLIDEEDVLSHVYKNEQLFTDQIEKVMVTDLETLDVQDTEDSLCEILSRGRVAILYRGETFLGFVTKVDLINRYKSIFASV